MADIRVCFTKTGKLKYISHLDLQRAVHRMLVRSGLPIGYSEGFNPHPRLNIALPLSIYQEGERELMDFRINEDLPMEEIKEKLQRVAFPGMDIIDVWVADRKLLTKRAVWRVEFVSDLPMERISDAFDGAMPVTKRSKKGEIVVDIAPVIKFIGLEKIDNVIILHIELPAAGNDYLNPSYVMSFFAPDVKVLRTVRENILF